MQQCHLTLARAQLNFGELAAAQKNFAKALSLGLDAKGSILEESKTVEKLINAQLKTLASRGIVIENLDDLPRFLSFS